VRIRTAAKRAHSCRNGNNQDIDLYGRPVKKFKLAWDISKNEKHLELKWVPLHECYVKSGLQEKSDGYLYGLAKDSHRPYTRRAWNMCCKNRKKYGIWGSDADVERANEGAILPGYTKGVDDNHKRRYNRKSNSVGESTLCALFK